MSFHPITVSSLTWNEVGPGKYMNSTVTYGSPPHYLLLSGGKFNPKTLMTTAAIACNRSKDVTVGSSIVRKTLGIRTIIEIPDVGFTTSDVDAGLLTLSDLMTVAFCERLLQGEQ